MKKLSQCPRRVFDDIHLYIQKIGNWENVAKLASEQFNLIEYLHDSNEIVRPLLSVYGEDSIYIENSFQLDTIQPAVTSSKFNKNDEQTFHSLKTSQLKELENNLSPELQRATLSPNLKLPKTAKNTDRDIMISRTTLVGPVIGAWISPNQRGYTAAST